MAGEERMTVEEVVRKVLRDEHADVIRESVKAVARELMEAEVAELFGAELGERRPNDRATHRNGYRARRWDTRAGEIELQIPKLRQGSSRASCSRASALSRRWCRWSSRPMSAASRRGGSISWWRASGCASASPRSAGSPDCSMSRGKRFGSGGVGGAAPHLFLAPPGERVARGG